MHSCLAGESGKPVDEIGQRFAAGPLRAAPRPANLHAAYAAGLMQDIAMAAS
jgi:hypothetical protein